MLLSFVCGAQVGYDRYFEDKSLRIDYITVGNADGQSNTLIYRRSICSLFGEWRTTAKAKDETD